MRKMFHLTSRAFCHRENPRTRLLTSAATMQWIFMWAKNISPTRWVAIGILTFLAIAGCDSKPSNSVTKSAAPAPVDVAAVRAKAEAGDAEAQAKLGKLYTSGEGVTNSYKEAAKWFQLAADKGNADAEEG